MNTNFYLSYHQKVQSLLVGGLRTMRPQRSDFEPPGDGRWGQSCHSRSLCNGEEVAKQTDERDSDQATRV
jgi:hypothetical protein